MKNNTISVQAYLINGQLNDVVDNDAPQNAIEEYFFPDSGAPVSSLVITAKTNDGKTVTLSLSKDRISASIE